MLFHPTMHRNQWHLYFEVYRSTLIQHTYLATPRDHLGVYKTWSLVCLCKHLPNRLVVTNVFCLDTLGCSHSLCVYTVHSTLTGYDEVHQVRKLHSLIYYFWMSPEWTTVSHSTPHGLKKFQSSPVFWGPYSGRQRLLRLLLVEVECTTKQPRHLENINDMQVQ